MGNVVTRVLARLGIVAVVTLAVVGCKAPPEAPEELSDLSRYLFREYDNDEYGVREAGMGNLRDYFADVDLTASWEDLAFEIDDLAADDVAAVEHPDRDLSLLMPVGLVTPSAFAPADHTDVILLADQTPVEPNSPDTYAREFLDPTDPSCFPGRGCSRIDTMNDIVKKNALMEIPYDMNKDYEWVELAEPGSGEWGILGRSWCQERAIGVEGNNEINQSFSIDVFLPDGDGGVRYMVLWSESIVPGFGEDVVMGTIKYGMHQMFDATEEYLVDKH